MSLATLPIKLIDFGERGRKDYGDLNDFCDDIRRRGLICPIAVIDKTKAGLNIGNPDLPYLLAAGGRRLTACSMMELERIDCRVYDHELSEFDYRGIELFENLKRLNLSHDEELDMKDELNKMYVDKYGPKISKEPDAPGWSIKDTAELLGIDPGNLSRDLKLKRTMDQFPEVAWKKCKNLTDAHKLAKKLTRLVTNSCAAEEITAELSKPENDMVKLVCDSFVLRDFFLGVNDLPDESYDLVEIDPPYAIDLAKKKKGNSCDGYNEISLEDYPEFMANVFSACYQKLKPHSWLICWFGPDPWYPMIGSLLSAAGFSTTGLVGIWAKGQETDEIISSACGQTHMPNSRLANAYEMFYYAWKGSPELNRPGQSNLFGCVPVAAQRKWHPTQRPRPLMRDLLTTFVPPGSRVLVPFAGSGETIISAYKEQMFPVGFELESTYKDSFIIEVGKEFR